MVVAGRSVEEHGSVLFTLMMPRLGLVSSNDEDDDQKGLLFVCQISNIGEKHRQAIIAVLAKSCATYQVGLVEATWGGHQNGRTIVRLAAFNGKLWWCVGKRTTSQKATKHRMRKHFDSCDRRAS